MNMHTTDINRAIATAIELHDDRAGQVGSRRPDRQQAPQTLLDTHAGDAALDVVSDDDRSFDWSDAIAPADQLGCWDGDSRRPTPVGILARLKLLRAATETCGLPPEEMLAFANLADLSMELGLSIPCRNADDLKAKAELWRMAMEENGHPHLGWHGPDFEHLFPVLQADIERLASAH